MPVTAKLSKQFYEKLGDEVTNELVTWLNAVDDSYRQEFRDLFAANFGQVRAEMTQLRVEMRAEMTQLRVEMRAEMTQLRGDMGRMEARIETKIEALKSELLRWMFLFWVGTMVTVVLLLKL